MEWLLGWLIAAGATLASDDLRWAATLGRLDDTRAEAFASADPTLLASVYVPGGAAREVDAKLIGDYARRGGRVVGAELFLLSCRVRHDSADRVVLDIVDQLSPARVEWADGTSRALPRDLPTRRVVTLVRTRDGWRIS